jgi:hypothetical protein
MVISFYLASARFFYFQIPYLIFFLLKKTLNTTLLSFRNEGHTPCKVNSTKKILIWTILKQFQY